MTKDEDFFGPQRPVRTVLDRPPSRRTTDRPPVGARRRPAPVLRPVTPVGRSENPTPDRRAGASRRRAPNRPPVETARPTPPSPRNTAVPDRPSSRPVRRRPAPVAPDPDLASVTPLRPASSTDRRRPPTPDRVDTDPKPSPSDRVADLRERLDRRRRRRRPASIDARTMRRRSRIRLGVIVALGFVFFSTVVVRLIDVQVNQREFWLEHGADARIARDELRVERGGIYDRNGAALALSVYRPNVVADPTLVPDPAATAAELAPILNRPEADLAEKLAKTNRYQLLARNVDDDLVERLTKDPDHPMPTGIFLEHATAREYPSGNLARAVIGRTFAGGGVDEDGRAGRWGIEAELDTDLRGKPGYIVYEKERGGGRIASTSRLLHEPTPGADVHLTIDQRLQYRTEDALITRIEELDASEATAIIMRPSTGEILSMATVAHGDDGAVQPTVDDRAAAAIYEPGSVTKMITIAAAMEEEEITADTRRRVPNQLEMADKVFADHDPHPVEYWSTSEILAQSSNVGTIQIAESLGADKLDHYLRSFGFGSPTGSDIPGEIEGLVPAVDRWSGTTLGSIAIGQTIAVTPLQLISAYNVIANDGLHVTPHVIGSTDKGGGRQAAERPAPRPVISPETAASMRQMLLTVVEDGTGDAAAVPGYRAWGKTGTARVSRENPTYPYDAYLNEDGSYDYASTFVGGVVGADLTILVVMKDPRTDQSGGEAAAPVFSELAAASLRILGTAPEADATAKTVSSTPALTGDQIANAASSTSEAQG